MLTSCSMPPTDCCRTWEPTSDLSVPPSSSSSPNPSNHYQPNNPATKKYKRPRIDLSDGPSTASFASSESSLHRMCGCCDAWLLNLNTLLHILPTSCYLNRNRMNWPLVAFDACQGSLVPNQLSNAADAAVAYLLRCKSPMNLPIRISNLLHTGAGCDWLFVNFIVDQMHSTAFATFVVVVEFVFEALDLFEFSCIT
jgi:hypothetical protein